MSRATNQNKTGVDQTERSRSPDARAAVYDGGTVGVVERTRVANCEEEVEKRTRLWNGEVEPGGVMKLDDLLGLLTLREKSSKLKVFLVERPSRLNSIYSRSLLLCVFC